MECAQLAHYITCDRGVYLAHNTRHVNEAGLDIDSMSKTRFRTHLVTPHTLAAKPPFIFNTYYWNVTLGQRI